MPNVGEALRGRRGRLGLAPVTHAVVVVVDGLGRELLERGRGHARTLAGRLDVDPAIGSGFPSTTASALASLTTGSSSGQHGLVGYTSYDPDTDQVVRLLDGWVPDGGVLDPATWQRVPTQFEVLAQDGIASSAVSATKYAHSGFTAAVLRGAEFRGGATLDDRIRAVREELRTAGPRLVYFYLSDLDHEGHNRGTTSRQWLEALELADWAVGQLAQSLGPRQGMLVTADHGMVDVPPQNHRVVSPDLLVGVHEVAGEPRCLQLHLEVGEDPDEVASRWRAAEAAHAWVATRAQAVAAGWFGEVAPGVLPRIGDVLVAARGARAYYTDADSAARRMIGQHGSLSAAELAVPLLRFGAFAG